MSGKMNEQLLNIIGSVDEEYIQEYIDAQTKTRKTQRTRMRFSVALAAAMVLLIGTVSVAAVPMIGHFLANLANADRIVMQNFADIEAAYAVRIDDTQECNGVVGTLNNAVVEDHRILLCYTFDWSGLEEAKDGSFHTYFLPWFFYITEGNTVLCQSEYMEGLYVEGYNDDTVEETKATYLYCIDLNGVEGWDLIGKELTVRLLYEQGGEGFTSTFTPTSCFTDRSWNIGKTYSFGEHRISLERIEESALYVTLFINCSTIGHNGDNYQFVLSDELGNDYTAYPNRDNDTYGYWFIKPEEVGTQLTLKVIHSNMETDPYGEIIDDSYEVLYEIPIDLKDS
ncbi:MAG: DUF4179 domain-containing protein [Lachnospiraceae bacterium]|nr:DUF4179 domain-containing protein [Lachnospiraceae bacterium]